MEDVIQSIRNQIEDHFKEIGIPCDYSLASLVKLENYITDNIKLESFDTKNVIQVFPYGVYLGDTLVENFKDHGAKWNIGNSIDEGYIKIGTVGFRVFHTVVQLASGMVDEGIVEAYLMAKDISKVLN